MKKHGILKLIDHMPTRKLAVITALGAIWFFAIIWGGEIFFYIGLIYNALVLGLVVADGFLLRDSRTCRVSRLCENTLSLGERNPVRIEAMHYGKRPLNIQALDEPPIDFEVESRLINFSLEPDERGFEIYRVSPKERGDYFFGDINVRYATRLGLLTRQERIPSEMSVKVYPNIFQTKKHQLLMKENRAIQMGLKHSRLRGQGREFERLRDYVVDDEPRTIDWKATAKRGSLIVREYDFEQSQNISLLLDLGRTMGSRTIEADGSVGMSKADYAINACVLLSHVAAQSDDRVGLFCFAEKPISYLPPGKGAAQSARLMEALYPVRARIEETNYFNNFTFFTQKQRKRSLVFLFTDLIDPDASRRLISSINMISRKHLVVCVALSDYELPGIIETEPNNIQDLYRQAVAINILNDRRKALAQVAAQSAITLDTTFSALSVDAVNKYLQIKREARL